jgi:hypothetical protein
VACARLVLLLLCLTGCELRKDIDPTHDMATVGIGVVEGADRTSIDNYQTRGERYASSAIGGVPAILVNTIQESESSGPNAWRYAIRLKNGPIADVQTFSAMQVGDCVLVRREGADGLALLVRQPPGVCREPRDAR